VMTKLAFDAVLSPNSAMHPCQAAYISSSLCELAACLQEMGMAELQRQQAEAAGEAGRRGHGSESRPAQLSRSTDTTSSAERSGMHYSNRVWLFKCDGCEFEVALGHEPRSTAHERKSDAERDMRENYGWTVGKKGDFCATCSQRRRIARQCAER
jgi:hypothetical protein